MFRENKEHLQDSLFSTLDSLSDIGRKKLEKSWAPTFYREVFMRLDEKPLAVLYSDKASRPNVPANVLVALEIIKAGQGWTDEEMHEEFILGLKVRYAVGYEQIGKGDFSLRTIHEFRRRLREHKETTGEDLLEQVFVQITDEQMKALSVNSDKLRMDSTQIASNIYQYGRLELLAEILLRVHRMLNEADRERFGELFSPYVNVSGDEPYAYRIKPDETVTRLTTIGSDIATLIDELAADYGQEHVYGLLQRVFQEHFVLTEGKPCPIPNEKISVTSLQAPDDPEATFHRKRDERYRGYAAHVTETCNPDNNLQLIVDVNTEPNATDDAQMLIATLPGLVQRTEVNEIYTDGGYNSTTVDPVLRENSVQHIQTALRGASPKAGHVSVYNCDIETDATGTPVRLVCPYGQLIPVVPGQKEDRFIGRVDPAICATCPFLPKCRARPKGFGKKPVFYFDQREEEVALKRQAIESRPPGQGNLRAAVESTIRSIKNPFRHGKVLVRGKFSVGSQVLGSALMVNLRRIHRYLARMAPPQPSGNWGTT